VLPSDDVNGDETMPPFAGKRADCPVPRHDPDPIPDIKAQLRQAVVDALAGWSQVNAAWWIGSDQGRVSDLRRNKLERFSVEQLILFLSRVDPRVEMVVHHERRRVRRPIVPSV
jgi:predicted XRE-type DNA-binding protein